MFDLEDEDIHTQPQFNLTLLNQHPHTAQIAWEAICKQTADHTLTVIQDNTEDHPNYRHLRMSNGGSVMWYWDIVTWPGHLSITGDIADGFTFRRTADMLDFFRRETNPDQESYDPTRRPMLNISYRAEKIARSQQPHIREINLVALIDTIVSTVEDLVMDNVITTTQGQGILDSYDRLIRHYRNAEDAEALDALRTWLEDHLLDHTGDITDYNPMDFTFDFYLAIYAIDKAVIEYYRHHANR